MAGDPGPVHIRTPHYVRGVMGEVVRHLGDFPNPEDLAFARPAEACRYTMCGFAKARSGRKQGRTTNC